MNLVKSIGRFIMSKLEGLFSGPSNYREISNFIDEGRDKVLRYSMGSCSL